MISHSDMARLLAWLDTIEHEHTRAVNAITDFFSEDCPRTRRAMLGRVELAALNYIERPGDIISTMYDKIHEKSESKDD